MPQKGSNFEREICKKLSLWWTSGSRDDVFWRSQTSGGRATNRWKKGKRTYGSYGDIASVDPIGEPLLRYWTIELKRGRFHRDPAELIECPATDCQKPFEAALEQTLVAHQLAESVGWMLISRKDFKVAVVYIDVNSARHVFMEVPPPKVIYTLNVKVDGGRRRLRFIGTPLENFLSHVKPKHIIAQLPRPKKP